MEGILRNTKVMGLVDGQVVSVLAFYPDDLSSNPGVATMEFELMIVSLYLQVAFIS